MTVQSKGADHLQEAEASAMSAAKRRTSKCIRAMAARDATLAFAPIAWDIVSLLSR